MQSAEYGVAMTIKERVPIYVLTVQPTQLFSRLACLSLRDLSVLSGGTVILLTICHY